MVQDEEVKRSTVAGIVAGLVALVAIIIFLATVPDSPFKQTITYLIIAFCVAPAILVPIGILIYELLRANRERRKRSPKESRCPTCGKEMFWIDSERIFICYECKSVKRSR